MSTTYMGGTTAPEIIDHEPKKFDTDPITNQTATASAELLGNLQRVLAGAIGAVQIATPERDASQNGRFRYERNWERLHAAIKQVVLQSGKPVDVPVVYYPPPSMAQQSTRFKPEDFPQVFDNGPPPSRGVGPSIGAPGTGAEDAWLNTQGIGAMTAADLKPGVDIEVQLEARRRAVRK